MNDGRGLPPGVLLFDGFLDAPAQTALLEALRGVAAAAPPRRMETPNGRRMSVAMTSAGRVGWVADRSGYRYEPRQPSGAPWPPIPEQALAIWRAVSGWAEPPDCLLLNHYEAGAKMGLHRDADEGAFAAPVVSVSLGDPARFRLGGLRRRDPTRSFELRSGDVLVMGGASRLIWHGVDRIDFGVSPLLAQGGRLNLTMRVVRP
ncbi:alpha-ketoglutarate-dependent dioxygenase AlkB [Pikeienuella sp. HZG-20]|uniref:alpha-ketoglutarate-dependent dioxygenase AlkB n=1 Tax=Paludibacillus litoralis TaxID=3133267 RepID=UPI0030ED1927